MAGKRNHEWETATEWDPAASMTQDKAGGVTQSVTPALVETKLQADGFPKIPSPSVDEVAVYGVGGWDSIKLANANIATGAAIAWDKVSKSGAAPGDVGAEASLGNPGVGNWFLRTNALVRSWVALGGLAFKSLITDSDIDDGAGIQWGKISKSGAIASDVGALPVEAIQSAGQLSGFADKENLTRSYNQTNRTVTITHPSGTIEMYWQGTKITRASPWTTAAHDATVNASYFYSSSDGVNFGWSTTPWLFRDIQVASIRRGTSLVLPINETHGLMDPDCHEEFHDKVWTYVKSGGALTAGTYALQVADNASITPGVDACVLRDEDLSTPLDALLQGVYMVCVPLNGEYAASSLAYPFTYAAGSYIQYYPADTGVPTTGQNGKYYNVYRVGVPTMDQASPVRWLWIAPQAQYDSLTLASAESFTGLRLGDLAVGTTEYCPVERIVYRSGSAYGSNGKVQIEAIQPLERVAGVVSQVGASVLSGSGTANTLPKWVSPSSLGDSAVSDDGTTVTAARNQLKAGAGLNSALFSWAGGAPVACWGHATGALDPTKHAIAQNQNWGTSVNSAAGQDLDFTIENAVKAQLLADGAFKIVGLAGTGTRPTSVDSTGKLTVTAKPDNFHGSWAAGSSTLQDVTNWTDPLVDEAHYRCFAAGKHISATATETRFRFIIGGVSSSTYTVYGKGDWTVNFDVTTIGGAGASVCANFCVYGNNAVAVCVELTSLSYISASGIRLQIASDDDNADMRGLCTRLERLQ